MGKPPHNTLGAERRKSRHYGMQALYQWLMAGAPLNEIEAEFRTDYDFSHVDLEYFQALLHGVPAHVDELDAAMAPLLDRSLEELDPIERTLLRMGIYELQHRIDVPYKVVINEAILMATEFGSEGGHTFVNGVLTKVAAATRAIEMGAASKNSN